MSPRRMYGSMAMMLHTRGINVQVKRKGQMQSLLLDNLKIVLLDFDLYKESDTDKLCLMSYLSN